MKHFSSKFLKDGAPVIAVHLSHITNLSIKLDTLKCKIEKLKPLFKKGVTTEAKYYKTIFLLSLYQN